MIRQISPGPVLVPDSASAAGSAPVTPERVDPVPVAASADPRDALAGALPAWDLLPAAPFIRRVK